MPFTRHPWMMGTPMKRTKTKGQEAPMVITPSALARLIKETVAWLRERRA
jgi:hypothetical protein